MPFSNRIYIFIEGNDDKDFLEKILKPLIKRKCNKIIHPIKYSEKGIEKIQFYIKTFMSKECPCFFVRDFDKGPCYTELKNKAKENYPELDEKNILIVKKSIDSWYLAGISDRLLQKYTSFNSFPNVEDYSKYKIKKLFPKGVSLSDIKSEILEEYALEKAIRNSESLEYIIRKFDLI